jgi:hypothetical protein
MKYSIFFFFGIIFCSWVSSCRKDNSTTTTNVTTATNATTAKTLAGNYNWSGWFDAVKAFGVYHDTAYALNDTTFAITMQGDTVPNVWGYNLKFVSYAYPEVSYSNEDISFYQALILKYNSLTDSIILTKNDLGPSHIMYTIYRTKR